LKFIRYVFLLLLTVHICGNVSAQVTPEDSLEMDSLELDSLPDDSMMLEEEMMEGALEDIDTGSVISPSGFFQVDTLFHELQSYDSFFFDTLMMPATHLYGVWDTIVIDPYRSELFKSPNFQIELTLQDSDDCFFYPPCIGPQTSGFGVRKWGRRYKYHYGIDINLETGDPVFAAFDGVVRIAKLSYDYGYVVVLRHYNGLETLCAHFSKLLVSPGQTVRAGDVIGLGGSTGRSTGSHLHFEIRFMGKQIDPARLIAFERKCLVSNTVTLDKTYFKHFTDPKIPKATAGGGRYYTVRKGDNLGKIAARYRTSVSKLCKLNRITTKTILRPGRKLRIR
jgi:hypothetical protein